MIALIVGQAAMLSGAMGVGWWFQKQWRNAGWADVFCRGSVRRHNGNVIASSCSDNCGML
jgi:hypothetical protein